MTSQTPVKMELTTLGYPTTPLPDEGCQISFDMFNQSLIESACTINKYEELLYPINFFLYALTLIGVVGNVALLVVILKTRQLRTTPNMLVINVTIGDLMYIMIAVTTRLEHQVNFCFPLNETMCKLSTACQVLGQGVCIYSIVAVSLERYGAITQHLGRSLFRGSAKKTGLLICIVWLASLVVAIPVFIKSKLHRGHLCSYLPHFTPTAKAFVTAQFICHYIVPLLIISVLYSRMAHTLIRSADSFRGENQPGARQFRARRRLAIIVLIIAVFFGVFWLPYYVYKMYFQFGWCTGLDPPDIELFGEMHYFMALVNSCFNPWIVFIMSSTHQRMLFRCLFCRQSATRSADRRTNMTTLRSNSFMNSTKNNYTEITSTM